MAKTERRNKGADGSPRRIWTTCSTPSLSCPEARSTETDGLLHHPIEQSCDHTYPKNCSKCNHPPNGRVMDRRFAPGPNFFLDHNGNLTVARGEGLARGTFVNPVNMLSRMPLDLIENASPPSGVEHVEILFFHQFFLDKFQRYLEQGTRCFVPPRCLFLNL